MTRLRIVALTLLFCLAAGCASVNPRPDEAALGYSGGPIQGTHYKDAFSPGSGLHWLGVFDEWFLYPTTVRTYIVSNEPGEGDRASVDQIGAKTKEGIPVSWQLAINFKINYSRLRKFHEQIGLTRHAYFVGDQPSEGWKQMLNDFFRQQIEAALQEVSPTYSADDVQKGGETYAKVNQALSKDLQARINESAGGNFFCGPAFNGPVAEDDAGQPCPPLSVAIKKGELPADVVKSYADQKVADNAKVTAENNGLARKAQADAEVNAQRSLREAYTDPGYIEYLNAQARLECAKNPPCGAGSGVIVDGRR